MSSFTPGKVILSGEHAIVHGRPALAMCVNQGVQAIWTPTSSEDVYLDLPGFPRATLTRAQLQSHLKEIRSRHANFLEGTLPVSEITGGPESLLLAALGMADPERGGTLTLNSTLPLGSGMGSSAACLLSLFRAPRPEWDRSTLYEKALACEHFQHGRSSGLDVAVCLSGTAVWAEQGSFTPLEAFHAPDYVLYHSGTPESSTGECVSAVAEHFPSSHPIWEEFETVTRLFRDGQDPRPAVHQNHQLLCKIGVVPPAIQQVIGHIEKAGGAAKICGAGSIRGDHAGVILTMGADPARLPSWWSRLEKG